MNGLSFIRRRCNLSQGQLAEKLGVTRQAKRHKAMFSAASQFSIPIFLDELELYEEHIVYNDAQFLRFLYKGIIINH